MFTTTKEDNVSNLRGTAHNFQNNADEAKNDLRDAANKAGQKVREIVNSASDEVSHAKDTVTTQIRSNPVQSSMIALGIGFVLGALLRR